MRLAIIALIFAAAAGLSGCASKFKTYNGPEVTRVVVMKGERRMHLLHHEQVLKSYDFDLGFAPDGDKQFEGDGKTPEGRYFIDRRNPNSQFHLSVGISYPNENDIREALAIGKTPGGDIFIHGDPNDPKDRRRAKREDDWTAGCIAVTNREIERIYAMVRDGTPIDIYP